MEYVVQRQQESNSPMSHSSFSTYRSAFLHLYRDYKRKIPEEVNEELAQFFKGLKREIVKKISDGQGSIKIGKDAMDIDAMP